TFVGLIELLQEHFVLAEGTVNEQKYAPLLGRLRSGILPSSIYQLPHAELRRIEVVLRREIFVERFEIFADFRWLKSFEVNRGNNVAFDPETYTRAPQSSSFSITIPVIPSQHAIDFGQGHG